ncbi:hypothetical protein T440DRAFT_467139 [Plenodomus tracheiphilus IPT5]|uniref:Methyltransferase domain-containing protein n=1 Tax=Plenodomus tracheiphilus IPT5 TaxID=1408161 RepID=A0A6A7B8K7_9PLEO|nr:hypothetical protein T440DRAFT_467139 [Plenodomus tracheiphilus IPT5]
MGPETPLPLPAEFNDCDEYVESLLKFTTSSWLLQTLCGGVHILDFYTRTPDLYTTILPQSWRDWFKTTDIMDIIDLLMREDLGQFDDPQAQTNTSSWRDGPVPPKELLDYIKEVRKHLLCRDFPPPNSGLKSEKTAIPRHIATGMKVKKVHEVDNFARYIDRLSSEIAASGKKPITHLVDFGSGQNYLGRALAATPYSKHIVAVESAQHNIDGAKNMDIMAKLVEKPLVMRNKKEYRAKMGKGKGSKKTEVDGVSQGPEEGASLHQASDAPVTDHDSNGIDGSSDVILPLHPEGVTCDDDGCTIPAPNTQDPVPKNKAPKYIPKYSKTPHLTNTTGTTTTTTLQVYNEGHGSVQYVQHIIRNGDLTPVIDQVLDPSSITKDKVATTTSTTTADPTSLATIPKRNNVNAMVVSLHSCGNLVHYGLRSLLLNPHISAVAMVGCCYNLLTERLGPPTYKLPTLRPNHPRLEETSNANDPNGFPMSEKLATYPLPHTPLSPSPSSPDTPSTHTHNNYNNNPTGIRLNITARMMAVQAPFNWGPQDSDLFFTRHFYRSLLQRIFLDRGVISAPLPPNTSHPTSGNGHTSTVNFTPLHGRGPGLSSNGTVTPLTIGTLRKFAFADFTSYVHAALSKLYAPNSFCEIDPQFIRGKMEGLGDEEIRGYERAFEGRKKELSVMWALMAFSAGVVESVIVVDRWLWLREQEGVERAWVEAVFEYGFSPRNLVVVGVKKGEVGSN